MDIEKPFYLKYVISIEGNLVLELGDCNLSHEKQHSVKSDAGLFAFSFLVDTHEASFLLSLGSLYGVQSAILVFCFVSTASAISLVF